MTQKSIKRTAAIMAVSMAFSAALTGCAAEKKEYSIVPDEQWTVAGSTYTEESLAAAARNGTVIFSFPDEGAERDTGILLGVPYPYTWIRVSANGRHLYEAGSKTRKSLCAAPKYVLLNRDDSAQGPITIEADMATTNGVARPFAAVGNERALLEAAARKSAIRIALSALNILLFAIFTLSFMFRKRTGHPSRTLAFGLVNLALALSYILETPLVILYSNDYLLLSVIEDCSYFFILPFVYIFIMDTLGLRDKRTAIIRGAILLEASLASAWSAVSLTFFSGAYYGVPYALSDFFSFIVTAALLVHLVPRALIRKGNERAVTLGVLTFTLCAVYELVMTDFPGLNPSSDIATTQIGFIVMVAFLGLTAIGRFDRMKWRIAEMSPTAERLPDSRQNERNEMPTEPQAPEAASDTANERRKRKIVTSANLEKKIGYLLDTERIWNEDSLTLPQFAELVGAPPHDVTLFINERYGMNFNTLINGRRLEEAKRLLAETDHTVLRVALEAGFSSKTAFYRFFRESTDVSPVEFRAAARAAKN